MAKTKINIRDLPDLELKNIVKTKKAEMREQRFNKVVGKLDNTGALKTSRRDIARAKTILQERKLKIRGQESK